MNFNIKFQSIIVIYNFCMIPHSSNFYFILGHFSLKQNPTVLQEVIQRLDINSDAILIIKSTLQRSFLMIKHRKNQFWIIMLFTKFNLDISTVMNTKWIFGEYTIYTMCHDQHHHDCLQVQLRDPEAVPPDPATGALRPRKPGQHFSSILIMNQ